MSGRAAAACGASPGQEAAFCWFGGEEFPVIQLPARTDGSLWVPRGCGEPPGAGGWSRASPACMEGGRRASLHGAGLRGLPAAEPPPPAHNTWKGLDVALNARQLCKPHGCKAAQRQTGSVAGFQRRERDPALLMYSCPRTHERAACCFVWVDTVLL